MDLGEFVKEAEKLILIFADRIDEEEDKKKTEELMTESGQQMAFLHTAWQLTRIARLYSKRLMKLQRQFPDFDLKLEEAGRRMQAAIKAGKIDG